jgi:Putative transposase
MVDTTARMVDSVFPSVPVRQWVLSLPFALRYRLAYDASAVSAVLRVFVRAIFESLRRRARDNGLHNAKCGAVKFIQRFGSALNLNVHFHVAVLDAFMPAPRDMANSNNTREVLLVSIGSWERSPLSWAP